MVVDDVRLHIRHMPLLCMPGGPVFWVVLVPLEYRIDVLDISLPLTSINRDTHRHTHAQRIPWTGADPRPADAHKHTAHLQLMVKICLVQCAKIGQPAFFVVFGDLRPVVLDPT